MQISPAPSIQPVSSSEQSATAAYLARVQAKQEQAAKDTQAAGPAPPAPAIRPTVQDYLDIDRWLLLLRQG